MLDVRARFGGDVRAFVRGLEAWVIDALDGLGVVGERREGRVGVWVRRPEKGDQAEDKIAAIGIRVRRGISLHGISLNVDCRLEDYAGIVPCGIREHSVTSLAGIGRAKTLADVDDALRGAFEGQFGGTVDACSPLAPVCLGSMAGSGPRT
jgi:lipoyl(octanoyl) transferase